MEGLTIPEAAIRLGVSADTVRRRVKSGRLKARREPHGRNHQWLIDLDVPAMSQRGASEGAAASRSIVRDLQPGEPDRESLASLRALVDELRVSLDQARTELDARRGEVARLLALLERQAAGSS